MRLLTMGHKLKKVWGKKQICIFLPRSGRGSVCHCLNPNYTVDSTISLEAFDQMKIIDQPWPGQNNSNTGIHADQPINYYTRWTYELSVVKNNQTAVLCQTKYCDIRLIMWFPYRIVFNSLASGQTGATRGRRARGERTLVATASIKITCSINPQRVV